MSAAGQETEVDVFVLLPHQSVTRKLANNSVQAYRLDLSAGDYCSAVVAKHDARLLVTIEDPAGRQVGNFIGDDYGDLSVSFVAESSGQYHLKIFSRERDAEPHDYALTVNEARRATELDRECQIAWRAVAAASELKNEWREESFRRAIEKYIEASAVWRSRGQWREAARSLSYAGDLFFILSDYRSALQQYRQAMELSRRLKDRNEILNASNSIGYVYANKGDQGKALQSFRPVLEFYRKARPAALTLDQLRAKAQVINNVGEVSYYLGDLKKATACFEEALVMGNAANDRRIQALAHLNLGYVFTDSGKLSNATAHFDKAQSLFELLGDKRGWAGVLSALGIVNSFAGERQKALDHHAQALDIFQQIGDKQGEAASLNSVGRIYEDLGEPRAALYDYARALKLFQESDNQDALAGTNYYLGRVYHSLKEDDQALSYYRQSQSLSRAMGKRRIEGYALTDMATIYGSRGLKQRALVHYRQVLKFYRQIDDRRAQSHVLNSIGHLYQKSGRSQKALAFYRQALTFSRSSGDRRSEALTLYNIARAERTIGWLEQAITDIRASLEISDAGRTKVGSEDLRASYFASVHDRYGFYVDLLMQMDHLHPDRGFKTAAFQVSDHARARSLLDRLAETQLDIQRGVDSKTLERGRALQEELALEAQREIRSNPTAYDANERAQRDERIRQLTTEFHEVQARIKEERLNSAGLLPAQPLTLSEIQAELQDDNTLLLEFELGDEKSYLWAVTSSSINSYELPARAKIEGAALGVYRMLTDFRKNSQTLVAGRQPDAEESDRQYWERAAHASDLLLSKVATQLQDKRLVIVADGALQYLPFGALPMPQPSGTSAQPGEASTLRPPVPLIANHEIVAVPAASILPALRLKRTSAPRPVEKVVVVMADPVFDSDDPRVSVLNRQIPQTETSEARAQSLPGPLDLARGQTDRAGLSRLPFTAREAQAIIAVTPPNMGSSLTGFAASRASAIGGELSQYQIVHFATHGIINDQHPELSGIVLSMVNREGIPENGFLQLHDIYGLNLAADVVVLSACDTGLGKDIQGEGMMGLTRAFLYAGSQSVVASLWTVDDEATAELMSHYYEGMIKDRLSPAAALQQAQRRMWQNQRWHEPYYWAAFVFQGDYREKVRVSANPAPQPGNRIYLLVLPALFLTGLALQRVWRKRKRALT